MKTPLPHLIVRKHFNFTETSMGPTALFDKSFLEALNPNEAVWFDHFFLANVCPMFYVECQSDLAKDGSSRGKPEELVCKLANKFPECSGAPNVYHVTMLTANLLGEEIPLRGQIVTPRGCPVTIGGNLQIEVLPESSEAKAFLRWTHEEFLDEERTLAAEWRSASIGCRTTDVVDTLKSLNAYPDKSCGTLSDIKVITDEAMNMLRPDQQLSLCCGLFEVPSRLVEKIVQRFSAESQPSLSKFAPYADFALQVELFFHLAVSKSRMGTAQRKDLCYLFYLPFCQLFVSKDWVHKESAPFFLREDQQFVAAEDLKTALRQLNDHYSALPEMERQKPVFQFASQPPKDGDNLVTKLWDRHWPKWRIPKLKSAEGTSKVAAAIRAGQLDNVEKNSDNEQVAVDRLAAIVRRRRTRKRKGDWWLVPGELRTSKFSDEQRFEFHNGASFENVLDKSVSVFIRQDAVNLASLPNCQTFVRDGRLHVDCAPPLNRQYVAPVPLGSMFALSNEGDELGLFVCQDCELAKLIQKLWEGKS